MAYLGNVPARSFISFERQVFTIVNSQTAYTLSHSVTNENDIRLVVNNVVQEPGSGKAYTASGTTLTLSAALTNGTDEMYCVFLGRAVGTVNAPAGSVGTSQLADNSVTTAKILNSNITVGKMAANSVDSDQYVDASIDAAHLNSNTITGQTAETSIATDDLILLSDTSASGALKKMTRANFVSGVGGVNTPACSAYVSGNQGISNATDTVVPYNAERYDSDNAFNVSNHRFVPQVAGKYHFVANVNMYSGQDTNLQYAYGYLRLNGSVYSYGTFNLNANPGRDISLAFNNILAMNGSSDYIDIIIYVYANITGSGMGIATGSTFSAFKIIE